MEPTEHNKQTMEIAMNNETTTTMSNEVVVSNKSNPLDIILDGEKLSLTQAQWNILETRLSNTISVGSDEHTKSLAYLKTLVSITTPKRATTLDLSGLSRKTQDTNLADTLQADRDIAQTRALGHIDAIVVLYQQGLVDSDALYSVLSSYMRAIATKITNRTADAHSFSLDWRTELSSVYIAIMEFVKTYNPNKSGFLVYCNQYILDKGGRLSTIDRGIMDGYTINKKAVEAKQRISKRDAIVSLKPVGGEEYLENTATAQMSEKMVYALSKLTTEQQFIVDYKYISKLGTDTMLAKELKLQRRMTCYKAVEALNELRMHIEAYEQMEASLA